MKILVNSSKNLVLLMIKPNVDIDYEAFDGCNSKLKTDLVDVVNHDDEVFQKAKGFLSERRIQHEIPLQQKYLLPNIGMHGMLRMESEKITKQIQGLLNKSII